MDLHYYVLQPLIASIETGNILHDCSLTIFALFSLMFISKATVYAMELSTIHEIELRLVIIICVEYLTSNCLNLTKNLFSFFSSCRYI